MVIQKNDKLNLMPTSGKFSASQKGFAVTLVLLLIGAAVILAGVFVLFRSKSSGENPLDLINDSSGQKTANMKLLKGERVDNWGCSGSGTVMFGAPPMDIKDIGMVLPLGGVVGAHVTPIDHMYFSPVIFNSPRDAYEVFAIADGVITTISRRSFHVSDENNGAPKEPEYQLKFWHSCDFASYFDLVTSLSPRLQKEFDDNVQEGHHAKVQISVKESELVGRIGGQTLDFSVFDYTKILPGFIVPEHYLSESWKLHVVNAFDYFKEPIRSQLLDLNPRTVEPRNGKIDYDIDGKLVGTWFKEGNHGFGSTGGPNPSPWRAHLSFAYDYIDPTAIVVSIGDYGGETAQFGVIGNIPDPATVGEGSLVKYELTQIEYYRRTTGEIWDRMKLQKDIKARPQQFVKGVALAQLLEKRKLKFEAFPGKSASQVNRFTDKAIIYER